MYMIYSLLHLSISLYMYTQGLFQKAEALYSIGNFEYALVFYHRGNKIRPELHEFNLGIQKAQEAIDNSIGSKSLFPSPLLFIELLLLCNPFCCLAPGACKLEKIGDLTFFQQQDRIVSFLTLAVVTNSKGLVSKAALCCRLSRNPRS